MVIPAGHRVLVKVEEIEEKTAGGLYIPKTSQDQQTQANIFGVVVAIGATAWKAFDDGLPWAAVGDRVAFAKYGGFVIEDPDTKELYRLLNDEDICAVIRG